MFFVLIFQKKKIESIDFDNFAFYFVFGLLIFAAFIIISGLIWHKLCHNGSDNVKFVLILRFFQSVGDFWTDVVFALVLYVENSNNNYNDSTLVILFICSCVFTLLPYIVSCATGIYWVSHWRASLDSAAAGGSHRLTSYFNKYEIFVYGLTTLAGFYRAIDFCQTKLFYLDMFHLQLTKDESKQLQHYRFLNIVALENIPQFIIQLCYLLYKSSNDNGQNDDINSIVFLSILFGVLSIVAASLGQVSRVCQKIRNSTSKFTYLVTLSGQFIVKSHDLHPRHAFAHDKLSQCIYDVLTTCDDAQKWSMRSDVEYSVEVYYIQNFSKTLSEIHVTFKIDMYTLGTNKKHLDVSSAIAENIQNMTQNGTKNFERFVGALRGLLNLRIILRLSTKNMNLSMQNLQKKDRKHSNHSNNNSNRDEGEEDHVFRVSVLTSPKKNTQIKFAPFTLTSTSETEDYLAIGSPSVTVGSGAANGGKFDFNKIKENEAKMIELLNVRIDPPKEVAIGVGLTARGGEGVAGAGMGGVSGSGSGGNSTSIVDQLQSMTTMSMDPQQEGIGQTTQQVANQDYHQCGDSNNTNGHDYKYSGGSLLSSLGQQGNQSVQLDELMENNK